MGGCLQDRRSRTDQDQQEGPEQFTEQPSRRETGDRYRAECGKFREFH
jgi:hypothetical protein